MKTIIALLLLALIGCKQNESPKLVVKGIGTTTDFISTKYTCVAFMFNPSHEANRKYKTFKELFLATSNITENDFQTMKVTYKTNGCIDVRVVWNGETTDYTFEEFQKLIWG